jgi:hypothetical protein
VTPALSAEGLVVTQPTFVDHGALMVRTVIAHSSGQWIASEYPVCSVDGDHKAMGAAMTYARRYALTAMLGIAADEDTDGDGAAKIEAPPRTDFQRPAPSQFTREPAPSKDAIAMGREVTRCATVEDIDALKRTGEFSAFWIEANAVDRTHVTQAAEKRKMALNAPILAAG